MTAHRDPEAELSQLFGQELERGGLRQRLTRSPATTLAAAATILRHARQLPVLQVRVPDAADASAVRRALRSYPVDRALTHGVAAVLHIPGLPGAYLVGRERMTVRRKVRAGERRGVIVRAVPPQERPRVVAMADHHERTNERAQYRSAFPDNTDLLEHDLWLAAVTADDDPLVLAVIPHAGEWAVLRHFRTLVSTPASSDARYQLSAALVEELRERGVRYLVDPLPPRWLPNGLRHFQRMIGFRLVRLRGVGLTSVRRTRAGRRA